MFSTLRTRFGIPGVISVIALVFAMFGGAYAASNNGGGKATASAKAKKGPRGPKGATGPAGPAGPTGPAGLAGAKGDAGANGMNGTNGTPGASVTSEEFAGAKEGHCTVGGSKFTAGASKTFACNGTNGTNGTTGFTETLPAGKTETGNWSGQISLNAGEVYPVAISYSIPLATGSEKVVYLNRSETINSASTPKEGCTLEVAPPTGTLCVFTLEEEIGEVSFVGMPGGSNAPDAPAGSYIWGLTNVNGRFSAYGTWAVTAK